MSKITKKQIARAEAFRQELLTGHGIGNKRQSGIFSRLIGGLSPQSLKRLEGQYAKIDIEPSEKAKIISKDLLARTREKTGRATAKNAEKVIKATRIRNPKTILKNIPKAESATLISAIGELTLDEWQHIRAQSFRKMLLDYHGITDETAKKQFEDIVTKLSDYEITVLSRQYKDAISAWEDSEGEAVVIAQDLLHRIVKKQSGKIVNNIKKEILKGKPQALTKKAVEKAKKEYNKMAEERQNVERTETGEIVVREATSDYMQLSILSHGPYGEKYVKQFNEKYKQDKQPDNDKQPNKPKRKNKAVKKK